MATRALAATGEQITNTETYVSSALAFPVQAYLPAVNAGAGSTVAVDAEVRVETTAGGTVELLTADGLRVGIVPPRSQAVVVARAGEAESEQDRWNFELLPQSPKAIVPVASDLATAITLVNALRTLAIDAGLMKAE